MQSGDVVRIHTDNPHMRDMINGKQGTIIEPDDGLFDWVVFIPGTKRGNGMFALDESNLEVI